MFHFGDLAGLSVWGPGGGADHGHDLQPSACSLNKSRASPALVVQVLRALRVCLCGSFEKAMEKKQQLLLRFFSPQSKPTREAVPPPARNLYNCQGRRELRPRAGNGTCLEITLLVNYWCSSGPRSKL